MICPEASSSEEEGEAPPPPARPFLTPPSSGEEEDDDMSLQTRYVTQVTLINRNKKASILL